MRHWGWGFFWQPAGKQWKGKEKVIEMLQSVTFSNMTEAPA